MKTKEGKVIYWVLSAVNIWLSIHWHEHAGAMVLLGTVFVYFHITQK